MITEETKMNAELEIKVESFRKIPNPYKSEADGIPQMYIAICDIKDIPKELEGWMKTNPREQNVNSSVAKKIANSLLTGNDFHLLNRGLLISAEDVKFNNYDNRMKLVFSDPEVHGDVDGGHTLRVILQNADDIERGKQYVRIEVLTGVESIFENLAEARNTSTQVKDQSIANLKNYFEMIKETISTEKYCNSINYTENGDGTIDITDMLAILNMFNIDLYKNRDDAAVISYSSKKKCINNYIDKCIAVENHTIAEEDNPYYKMKNIIIDIFKLYDTLESSMATFYAEKVPGGRYGAITGVTLANTSKGKYFYTKFYGDKIEYSSPNGFIYPILGAFRALVVEKDGMYVWKDDPFVYLKRLGPQLVLTTVERSRTLGNNPNKVGKDTGHWIDLYKTVMIEALINGNNE